MSEGHIQAIFDSIVDSDDFILLGLCDSWDDPMWKNKVYGFMTSGFKTKEVYFNFPSKSPAN